MENFEKDDVFETLNGILDYYYSKVRNGYIPALIEEEDLFKNKRELYLKLIAVEKDVAINKTWMKDNLSQDSSNGIFNLVSAFKYNNNTIYGINPIMWSDYRVSLMEQKNLDVLNMEFIEDNKIKSKKILIKDNNDYMLYYESIRGFLESYNGDGDYDLYAEIEYRVFNNNINPKQDGVLRTDNAYIDLVYQYNDGISIANKEKLKLYWLRATVKLDKTKLLSIDKSDKLNIKVVDFGSDNIRELNTSNYNDDMNAGLVVFSKDSADVIKKYYYFYDLVLQPKAENVKSSLVDYFDDIIVFWEGEFNSNLPYELKFELQKFNVVNKTNHLISKAMFNWQLQCQWDVYDDMLPNQQLARIVSSKKMNLAKEYGIDFYPPKDITEYSIFVKNILKLFDLKIQDLRLFEEHEKVLSNIIEGNNTFNDYDAMITNYYGFCYLITKVIGYDKK